jgi:2,5-diketo-D-gluconate reductase A
VTDARTGRFRGVASIATMADHALPTDSAPLTNGAAMPLLGFGTWQITGDDATRAVAAALETGYRHLDTAHVYGNENEVGRALADSGVSRDDVFVTTKCPPDRASDALAVLRQSLDSLQTDHLDLWLIHWPGEGSVNPELWQKFVEARESGLTREIGVSNFDADLIDEVTAAAGGVKPAVNQIEWSPLLYDAATVAAHRERGVVLEGYSGLRGGTLDHPTIVEIAERLGRTTAQVIIRWHLEHGFVAIPKSVDPERIASNAQVADFALTDADVAALDALGGS